MNPFEKIPQSEIQFFKEKVQRWVNVDEKIISLESEIKELKKVRNKELEPEITGFMVKYNVSDLNIDTDKKLRYKEKKTKQALNVPCAVPAFINVGEFGMNSKFDMISKKSASDKSFSTSSTPYMGSIDAIALATRLNKSVGDSMILESVFFNKYLCSKITFAWSDNSTKSDASCCVISVVMELRSSFLLFLFYFLLSIPTV